jgi:hypothetical protein
MTYETIKIINNIEILRAEGKKFPYIINIKGDIRDDEPWKEFHTFKTCKAAVEFAQAITK